MIVVDEAEMPFVVPRQSDDQGAVVAIADILSACGFEFRGKGRPGLLAPAVELQQLQFAGFGFDAGGEHAGGGMTGAPADRALVEDVDPAAGLRQPPADAQPAHAGADDGDGLRASGTGMRRLNRTAPYAGMTQVRFDGYDLRRPALQQRPGDTPAELRCRKTSTLAGRRASGVAPPPGETGLFSLPQPDSRPPARIF